MKTLIFDIETHSAHLMRSMDPEEFVRIAGYSWAGSGHVALTCDLEELRRVIREADMVIGHNIHAFDLPAVFGPGSDEGVEMADQGRVYDTMTHGALVHMPPRVYTNRDGHKRIAESPGQIASWFSLDEQAFQLRVTGKTHDLKKLAHEFGDPDLPRGERITDGFGKIPVTEDRYRDYLTGDVTASEAVARALLRMGPLDAYAMREQRIAARAARISANGFKVDTVLAAKNAAVLQARKQELIARLARDYGFPTDGAKPWASKAGKEAIFRVLADHGITEDSRPGWERTATGNLSLGADAVLTITRGTDAADLGVQLAELQGQRSLAQLALDSAHRDGFAHPDITMLQRSGRWSTTKPGLTVWSERDKAKRQEKAVFTADSSDHVLLELDYSAADARVVAALSGDEDYAAQFGDDREALARMTGIPDYADLFKGSAGGHAINAVLAFGADTVASDPAGYRQKAKALGHAWNYGAGPRRLAGTSGLPLEDATAFCDGLSRAYPRLVRWQNKARYEADHTGYVTNPWGRRMKVDRDRSYTQAPAFLGQSGTREIVCDALLSLSLPALRSVKAQIHDALVVSVPRDRWEACRDYLAAKMTTEMDPEDGQKIGFPVSCGPPADNWADAGH